MIKICPNCGNKLYLTQIEVETNYFGISSGFKYKLIVEKICKKDLASLRYEIICKTLKEVAEALEKEEDDVTRLS